MRVIQLLTTLTYGDAVGNDALALDKVLKKAKYKTGIYAERIGNRIPSGTAHSLARLPKIKPDDVIIYHFSTGTSLNFRFPEFGGKKILIYHNVTPERFFSGYSVSSWNLCRYGIEGVQFLADKVDYCLADSSFNKQNLESFGYKCQIDVLPILIPFDDYRKEPNRDVLDKYMGDGYTNILFTGRIAPNKCQEDVIAAFYKYHTLYNSRSRLFLVGNYAGMEKYFKELNNYVKNLGLENEVVFTGHISFDEILAYYYLADMFLCMSEHEGFCVPLVESMFFDIPIIAYDSTAIASTLGGSGFLIKEKNPTEIAGAVDYIIKNEEVKRTILEGQRERLADFDHDSIENQFLFYLKGFIEGSR